MEARTSEGGTEEQHGKPPLLLTSRRQVLVPVPDHGEISDERNEALTGLTLLM
jgi:hypothetical protein